jgi:hypothetical protein
MVADNTLEPDAIFNLQQLAQVGSSADVNFVVEIDRGLQYSTAPILNVTWSAEGAKRLLVQQGSFQVLSDLGPTDSGATQTLADFIHWGLANYPAKHTALFLWDHGGSWSGGFGIDETSQDGFSIAKLSQAITQGIASSPVQKFDLLGFDACLMASVEVLDVLGPFTRYYLASEESEPGLGWDYTNLALLKGSPTTDAVALGKALIDGFIAQNQEQTTTLALVDASRFSAVRSAITNAASQLRSSLPTATVPIARARGTTLEFGHQSNPSQSFNVVDLLDFLNRLSAQSSTLSTVANSVATAMQQAILYEHHGAAEAGASGLSIYFPATSQYYTQTPYSALSDMDDWRSFLEQYYASAATVSVPAFSSGLTVTTDINNNLVVGGNVDPATSSGIITSSLSFGFSFPESSVGAGDDVVAFYGDKPASLASNVVSASWNRSLLYMTQSTTSDYAYLSASVRGSSGVATIPLAYLPPTAVKCGATGVKFAYRVVVFDLSAGTIQQDSLFVEENGAVSVLTPQAGSTFAPVFLEYIGSKQLTQGSTSSGWFCSSTRFAASPLPTISFYAPTITSPIHNAFLMRILNAGGQGDARAAFGNY